MNNSFVELIQLHPEQQQSSCPHYPTIRFSGRIIEKIGKSGRSSHTTPVANPILTKSGYISRYGIAMRWCWGVWVLWLTTAGCHGLAHTPMRLPEQQSAPPSVSANDLPLTNPTIPVLDTSNLPKLPARTITGPEGLAFRRVREIDCLTLAANNTSTASLLDEQNQAPARAKSCNTAKEELLKNLRYHTALELRNRSAADALERFFQLTELEARTDLLRKSFPIVDVLTAKAKSAKAADVRFPLEVSDLTRERLQMESQLEQAELGSRLLDLDLKRRLGLPYLPIEERLWPVGDFAIDPTPLDPEAAVNAALADRPELRGLRAFHQGLTVDTLPDARDLLRLASPLLGLDSSQSEPRLPWLIERWLRRKGPDADAIAELEMKKKQLRDVIVERERAIANETRAAVLTANSQIIRASLARDRLLISEEKFAEADRKRVANQPGAEFLVPQMQLEVLKARSELAAEVAAWHQARIKVKAAQGWLVWEAMQKNEK